MSAAFLLSLIVFLPALGALVLAFMPSENKEGIRLVTLGIERWRQNRTELAKVLQKNPDVVSWWAGEGATRRMEDAEFAGQLDRMDQELARRASRMTPSERLNPTS